jgi:hypothetical protein
LEKEVNGKKTKVVQKKNQMQVKKLLFKKHQKKRCDFHENSATLDLKFDYEMDEDAPLSKILPHFNVFTFWHFAEYRKESSKDTQFYLLALIKSRLAALGLYVTGKTKLKLMHIPVELLFS